MKRGHWIAIIAALLGVIGTITGSIIGVIWGKSNINVIVQVDGKNVILKDADIQELALENEELKKRIYDYEIKIENLENESKDLTIKLENANGELEGVPSVEFQNLGLSIDGEEQDLNKDKSYVSIKGRQYYSSDFVDKLIPDNMSATNKDGILYIGKIVKEKSNLLDKPIIEKDFDVFIYDNVADTYGNIYDRAVCFQCNGHFVVFNANREYSKLKCVISMQEGYSGGGIIQIVADDNIVYTSPEITSQTEAFETDIPINMASKITIKSIGNQVSARMLVSNCILYNEE